MREVTAALWERDVIPDYRDPDGLRIGLSPLSTSFDEVERGLELVRETAQPDRRRPSVLARNGPTRRGPASRLSSRRASRLIGCARYSPRITPAASASATDAAVTMASTPRLDAAAPPAVSSERPRKIERPGSSGTIADTTTTSGGTRAQPATPYADEPDRERRDAVGPGAVEAGVVARPQTISIATAATSAIGTTTRHGEYDATANAAAAMPAPPPATVRCRGDHASGHHAARARPRRSRPP